jgi:FMN phosphatase YigB (HAD superfamily)
MESESTKSRRKEVENDIDKVEEKNSWIMQELNHIKNIVFDLGGVLIDLEPERALKAFVDLKKYSQTKDTNSLAEKEEKGKSPMSINDLIGGGESEWMQKYQIGEMTTEELALRAGFTH